MQRGNLSLDGFDRSDFLPGIAPVDVQASLDAGGQEQRDSGATADVFDGTIGELRHELHDAASGVAEKVEQDGHAQHRRRMGRVAGSRLAIHPLELLLKSIVEQNVPLESQKPKQFAHSIEPLHDQIFSLRQLDRWGPSLHASTSWPHPIMPRGSSRSPSRKRSNLFHNQADRCSRAAPPRNSTATATQRAQMFAPGCSAARTRALVGTTRRSASPGYFVAHRMIPVPRPCDGSAAGTRVVAFPGPPRSAS